MIKSEDFLSVCKEQGFTLFSGTPCSYLKPFINTVIDDDELEFIETTNEGDAVALASGAWLGGRKSIVMFQNSGLGNAVNPITSLSNTMRMPFLGIVTLRGEPGGAKDEPQHGLMGAITIPMLETMDVKWSYFPTEKSEVEEALRSVDAIMNDTRLPYFFVMRKNSVEPYELKDKSFKRNIQYAEEKVQRTSTTSFVATRTEALQSIKNIIDDKSVVIATTGKTGRELFEVKDCDKHLYMVGSMGCALPIGLGVKKTQFDSQVCVIDGDGAILMRLGNMALAGQMAPKNLVHIVLDNGAHDSTGGQRSYSEHVDLGQVALSCGYKHSIEAGSISEFEAALKECITGGELSFIRFFTVTGSPKNLGRPTVTPDEVSLRMRNYITGA